MPSDVNPHADEWLSWMVWLSEVERDEASQRIADLERERDEARKEVAKLRDVEAMLMDAEQRIARLKSAVNRGRPYP